MTRIQLARLARAALHLGDAAAGRVRPLERTLADLAVKPARLGLEFSNLCNADCVFCPYQHQQRPTELMSDAVFEKAVGDFVDLGGGDVELTPVVGEALIHPRFLARVRWMRSHAGVRNIELITNGILIDRHGVDELLDCGLTSITISTAGFEAEMYRRVYRSSAYERMRANVLALAAESERRGRLVPLTIALRPDRPLRDVLKDPDFQPILAHGPIVRANRLYSDAGGRIRPDSLPGAIRLRVLRPRPRPCAYTFYGPIVLSSGEVLVCNCLASMDAAADLGLGNILSTSLLEIWRSARLLELRASFGTPRLNGTCASCTMYHSVDALQTASQALRARRNRRAWIATGASPRRCGNGCG